MQAAQLITEQNKLLVHQVVFPMFENSNYSIELLFINCLAPPYFTQFFTKVFYHFNLSSLRSAPIPIQKASVFPLQTIGQNQEETRKELLLIFCSLAQNSFIISHPNGIFLFCSFSQRCHQITKTTNESHVKRGKTMKTSYFTHIFSDMTNP